MDTSDGVRDVGDVVREHEESASNAAFDERSHAMSAKIEGTFDVFKLQEKLNAFSSYREVVIRHLGKQLRIVEVSGEPKDATRPFGTVVLTVEEKP